MLEILQNEYDYTEKIINNVGGRYQNASYEVISSSNECLELLLGTITTEMEKDKSEQQPIYVIYVKYNNSIIMTIGCYPNHENRFQLNNFITKHTSNVDNIKKNISMALHSYAASLFDSKYIIVKEPLECMKSILLKTCSQNTIIIPQCNYSNFNHKKFECLHEQILNCPYDQISYHGIGNYGESLIISVTDEIKELYKSYRDLEFGFCKIT